MNPPPSPLTSPAFALRTASWLVLVLVARFGFAAAGPVGPYSVRSWQKDDGLPNSSVFALTQTQDGYLWVGTPEGLVRFDGVRFTKGFVHTHTLIMNSATRAVSELRVKQPLK